MAMDREGRSLSIAVEQRADVMIVHLVGEVDLNVSPKLRAKLKEVTTKKAPFLVIDMAGVPYIDSSGVATLVECLQSVSRYQGKLHLCSLTPRASGVFEISRLDTVFRIFGTLEEAIKS
jgi:anti-sigma B factor antagonist